MNFKKILCMGLAVLSVFASSVAVGAQEAEVVVEEAGISDEAELMAVTEIKYNGIMYECDSKAKTAVAIEFLETHTKANIPASFKSGSTTYEVTGIADGFASGSEKIIEVNLSAASNLETIGENVFSYCPNITAVKLPKPSKLNSIGNNAFYYCKSLALLENSISQTVLKDVGSSFMGLTPYMEAQTDEFVTLGKVVMKYNGTAKNVKVPSGTTAIADAFFGKDITSIDLGDDLVTIGNNAFYGCRSLESVKLPKTCTKVGDMAFAGCTSLKSVEYAGKLASIGFCSFANCSELTTFKYTGTGTSTLTNIGECAFWNDRKLTHLDAGTIVNVNVGSFWNCFGDTSDATDYYRIPNTVKTIAEGGYGNLSFSYVTVPESVEALASTAFGSTSGATYIVKKGSAADNYFEDSGYKYIYYGDMNCDGKINAKDFSIIAEYLAKEISDLNYNNGTGVIIDGDGDGVISMKDLNDIFKSIKDDYEAEN